jgi:hypothetical protein
MKSMHGDSHAYAAQGARAHLDDHGAFQPGRLMAEKSLALSILRVQGAPLHRPDIPWAHLAGIRLAPAVASWRRAPCWWPNRMGEMDRDG